MKGENVVPGTPARTPKERIAALRAFARSDFPTVGTCRMGTDALAVVDPQSRVGVRGLRPASAGVNRCGRLVLGRG
ncbi:GMC oxidoreductase [Streptomyces sp. NPDC059209]|uniref:GMC oxidoreductase n=1 Tax=Streptomyces sp. NPDC059209 TaxID=3346769 RepID=UPI0036A303FC